MPSTNSNSTWGAYVHVSQAIPIAERCGLQEWCATSSTALCARNSHITINYITTSVGRTLASNPGFPFRILNIFLQSCETKSGTESLGSRLSEPLDCFTIDSTQPAPLSPVLPDLETRQPSANPNVLPASCRSFWDCSAVTILFFTIHALLYLYFASETSNLSWFQHEARVLNICFCINTSINFVSIATSTL